MVVFVTLCTKEKEDIIRQEKYFETVLRSVHLNQEDAEDDLEDYILEGDRLLSWERRRKILHSAECCIIEETEVIE